MESRPSIFFAELRRRKVIRVAVAYAVVGFVVWQAAEIAFPALGLPDEALTFVVVTTVLGFPIALVLSWAYELRPEEPRDVALQGWSDAAVADLVSRAAPTSRRPGPGLAASLEVPAPGTDNRPGTAGSVAYAGHSPSLHEPPRVLVVDDDEDTRAAHSTLIESLGYDVETASDGIEALAKLSLDVDLVMLDVDMPDMDGFEVARRIRADAAHVHVPIVMVTGLRRPQDREKAIEAGVNDFVLKPVDAGRFELRAKWLLELKGAYDRLANQQAELERMVERKTAALREALEQMTEARRVTHEVHMDTIRRLTLAAEYVDRGAAGHIHRVGLYSEVVAEAMGLPPTTADKIRHAAPMHDVGKIGIPQDVLMKSGELSEPEWELMKSHTTIGAGILSGSLSPVIQMGEAIALTHHERWDGAGYPEGLAGKEIPIEGRICAIVDYFDALTMDRPHRKALPSEEVLRMLEAESGAHFDPTVVEAFFDSLAKIGDIQAQFR